VSGHKYVRSVLRALEALEVAGNCPRGVSLYDISNALGITKPAAHYIVQTLMRKGFLERLTSPTRFKLGPVMVGLRARQDRWNRDVLARATPLAIRLARELDAAVFVSQHVGGEVIARLQVDPGERPMPGYHYSRYMWSYGAAVIFQAFMDQLELQDFRARHPIDEYHGQYWGSYQLIDDCMELVRRDGCLAFVKSDVFRVAAGIFERPGTITAMISATKRFNRMQPNEPRKHIELVRRAAEDVSLFLQQKSGLAAPPRAG